MKHQMVFAEISKYCGMHQNFIIFSSIKKLRQKNPHTNAAKFKMIVITSQNTASDISVIVDMNVRLAFLR